ncbi:hypothetical protein [Sphingomonas colocasiae]|uniref:Uncharacterized protein n=1 Tax=Sphingomonas colocasiae TaxID=1848973 RepID=A0ABS7PYI9_9SPHN|nr:hypothetical protein [Sphingomonas colocasiae]MBY8823295.1 hypothetical protein [Sphingomonas colocasiae]MBY8826430.1 hypothetical protein [Sphingomonas colocasiae]
MARMGLVAIMAIMSEEAPCERVADAVLRLAHFLNDHHGALSDAQAAELLALGACLWRRSVELGDTSPEIDAAIATKQ